VHKTQQERVHETIIRTNFSGALCFFVHGRMNTFSDQLADAKLQYESMKKGN